MPHILYKLIYMYSICHDIIGHEFHIFYVYIGVSQKRNPDSRKIQNYLLFSFWLFSRMSLFSFQPSKLL